MKTIALDYVPYDYQLGIHDSPKRFHLIVGGRRVGKSKMALMELVKHCIQNPGADAWWVAPTFSMAREIGWEEFQDYKEDLGPIVHSVHETLLRVKFKNGSTIHFKGADSERSLRGRGLTYLVIDEAAFIDPLVWTRALYPALTDKKGKALLVSTPNGRNWFYDLFHYAHEDERWEVHTWPTEMNPLITPAELEQSRSMVSEMDFRQEFLAEFVTREGMVYDNFSDDNILETLEIDQTWQIYLGVDFGYANPTAVAFCAVDGEGTVVQFEEVYGSRLDIIELDEQIRQALARHKLSQEHVQMVYTDPAGNATEMTGGISPVDALRDMGWKVENKGSEIAPGLAQVRSFIRAADGTIRFYVTKNCKNAIRSLFGYTYEKRSRNNETIKEDAAKDGIHDHMCDAIRYFFVNRFATNKYFGAVPTEFSYSAVKPGKIGMKRCMDCHSKFPSRTPEDKPPFKCKRCLDG